MMLECGKSKDLPVRFIGIYFLAAILVSGCSSNSVEAGVESATPAVSLQLTRTVTTGPTSTIIPITTSPSITPTPARFTCWQQGGQISEEYISSELLPNQLEFMLYVPPCYRQQPDRHYPVLYLIHGRSFTHTQWDRIGSDEIADQLIATGELSPFIIVMPRYLKWGEPSEDMFGEAIMQELIPWIDANYRTIADRNARAIGGLSRGAAWAVHLGIGQWQYFGTIGLHSMTLFWEDTRKLPSWLEDIPPDEYPRIFVDVGNRDFDQIRTSTAWFGELLTSLDIPHEWYSYTGTHDEAYWSSHIEQYIRFYAGEW